MLVRKENKQRRVSYIQKDKQEKSGLEVKEKSKGQEGNKIRRITE